MSLGPLIQIWFLPCFTYTVFHVVTILFMSYLKKLTVQSVWLGFRRFNIWKGPIWVFELIQYYNNCKSWTSEISWENYHWILDSLSNGTIILHSELKNKTRALRTRAETKRRGDDWREQHVITERSGGRQMEW